ncbi:hypothetical protein AB0F42_19690 [Streptomyces buecherae]|uniref:hypothetical protein n=1 Tax=Streptomyces buecherae TaxID=2763006 RepID=UPI0033CD23C9
MRLRPPQGAAGAATPPSAGTATTSAAIEAAATIPRAVPKLPFFRMLRSPLGGARDTARDAVD